MDGWCDGPATGDSRNRDTDNDIKVSACSDNGNWRELYCSNLKEPVCTLPCNYLSKYCACATVACTRGGSSRKRFVISTTGSRWRWRVSDKGAWISSSLSLSLPPLFADMRQVLGHGLHNNRNNNINPDMGLLVGYLLSIIVPSYSRAFIVVVI